MRILLCVNGTERAQIAARYGCDLAQVLGAQVLVLGVIEVPEKVNEVERALEALRSLLRERGVPFETATRKGRVPAEIARETRSRLFDLTVVGSLGRAWWTRFLRGPSSRRILKAVEGAVLVVKVEKPFSLQKALICSGGLSHADKVARFGGQILQAAGAKATLLHVVDDLTLTYLGIEGEVGLEEFLKADIPQSGHFKMEAQMLRSLGLEVALKLRHGLPFEEIIEEIKEGAYDLVVMGSTYAAIGLRHYFVSSTTDKVVDHAPCPVLVVR